jgi:hypothetical protein
VVQRQLPILKGTDRWFYGNITKGKKFGFEVGTSLKISRSQHRPWSTYYGTGTCAGTYKIISGCVNSLPHASFNVSKTLYHGQIFVEFDNNYIIKTIVWNADIFPLEWNF